MTTPYMTSFYPFAGCNPASEIESYEEFLQQTQGKEPSSLKFDGWVFQSVDLSLVPVSDWEQYDLKGALFMSCVFPPSVTFRSVRLRGASVWEEVEGIPFKAHKGFMYTQEELQPLDNQITTHAIENRDFITICSQSMHDWSITDALEDYLEGKAPVTIMGGHGVARSSPTYARIVHLARRLSKEGFLIVTGGVTGVAEAGNLGSYLVDNTDEEVEQALKIMSESIDNQDTVPVKRVLELFGPASQPPRASVGIPTFSRYCKPTNSFATWIAKYFSSAIRDDILLKVGIGAMIFCEGSSGTRQKLFQAACRNHYCPAEATIPMVLFDPESWPGDLQVAETFKKCAAGREYEKLILSSNNIEEIVAHIVNNATTKQLPTSKPRLGAPTIVDWTQ
eukprot:TRINITY_DN13065_c0_g1_i1.p1 TRINITY_DN13065_c0_g1~~TRINITY_DN13065_c0_g1_i1.p1  ORF type:complete len:393 (+),score=84.05 TRINITY_DN13065_c0_g1_i1:1179-2357(+)